jgi:hypothetical protein
MVRRDAIETACRGSLREAYRPPFRVVFGCRSLPWYGQGMTTESTEIAVAAAGRGSPVHCLQCGAAVGGELGRCPGCGALRFRDQRGVVCTQRAFDFPACSTSVMAQPSAG